MTKDQNKSKPEGNKQLMLLVESEAAYSQAASVLFHALTRTVKGMPVEAERLETGLHLLEEAMAAHNRYAESIK